ncbi:MAG: helix-turn-helix domain-containing protein [Lachnospiraceae bacterium]|nr:helix-turn-helix domain-containing protein [Lachnospiraceae bacterium]
MAIGERINYFRRRCNLTMSALGQLLGFDAKGADVRIAQYENNSRKPKAELTQSMADVFGVVPEALTVPEIDTYKGLLHTLFALEDIYGLTVDRIDDVTCLHLDKFVTQPGTNLWQYLDDWYAMKEKYIHGRITKEEYDHWRYNFPNDGTSVLTAKVPPERFL